MLLVVLLTLSSTSGEETWSAPPLVSAPVEVPVKKARRLPPPPPTGRPAPGASQSGVAPQQSPTAVSSQPPASPVPPSAVAQEVAPSPDASQSAVAPRVAPSGASQSVAPPQHAQSQAAVVPHATEVSQSAPKEPERDFPLWQVTALATANVPLSLDGSDFLLGFRGELDVWRIGAVVTFDRTGTTPLTMSDTRHWTGLAGYALLLNRWLRVRALGGVSALATDTTSTFGPSLGATARVGWSFLGAEAAAVFTPLGFRQLDLRAEAVLKGGVFELHAGYRARFLDASSTGTLDTLFASAPVAGPHIAIGLSF